MASIYDEVEIEDFDFDTAEQIYYYPCPCGDRFQISLVCWVHLCSFILTLLGGTPGRRGDRPVSELLLNGSSDIRRGMNDHLCIRSNFLFRNLWPRKVLRANRWWSRKFRGRPSIRSFGIDSRVQNIEEVKGRLDEI